MYILHKFDGVRMWLNNDYITHRFILDNGLGYERHVRRQIERFIPTSSVMWDIGSNAGIHTCSAKQVKRDLKVVCFEPSITNRQCLLRTIHENKWDDVFVVPAAVDERDGVIGINTCPDDPVCGECDSEHTDLTPAFRLDSFELPLPDFVKIDIEGFEPRAMRGASKMLHNKPVIVSELNGRLLELHGGGANYMRFFKSIGYSVSLIWPTDGERLVDDADDAMEYVRANLNYICDILCVPT